MSDAVYYETCRWCGEAGVCGEVDPKRGFACTRGAACSGAHVACGGVVGHAFHRWAGKPPKRPTMDERVETLPDAPRAQEPAPPADKDLEAKRAAARERVRRWRAAKKGEQR